MPISKTQPTTVMVTCPEKGFHFPIPIQPASGIVVNFVPKGANKPAVRLQGNQYRLIRYCPFCNKTHEFEVTIPGFATSHTHKQGNVTKSAVKINLTDQYPFDRTPILSGVSLGNMHVNKVEVIRPTYQFTSDRSLILSRGLKGKRKSIFTPADAAREYNFGGELVLSNDPWELKRAVIALRRARIIYMANNRPRDAAYAAVQMAMALTKLGHFAKAKKALAFTRGKLTDKDEAALRRIAEIEKRTK